MVEFTLTNADLVGRFSLLADYKAKAVGGTNTTLIGSKVGNVDLSDFPDGYFNNSYICFLNGNNRNIDSIIIDFNSSLKTFTFSTLESPITNTVEFAIVTNGYLSFIESAEDFLREKFKNDGYDLNLFLTTQQLKELHIYKTLDMVCLDKFEDADDEDLYWNKHLHYEALFNNTYNALKADYDTNEDGVISKDEELKGGSYGVLRR